MTRPAPEFSPREREIVARFEAAPVLEEAWHPDRQGTREELAAALRAHQTTRGMRVSMGWTCACGFWSKSGDRNAITAHQADALLPVVERLCDQRAAEALEAAARDIYHGRVLGTETSADWLSEKAERLRAALRPAATRENGAG